MPIYKPYSKGRWYRFFIESDGESYTLTKSDLEDATISGSRLKTVEGFHVLDVIEDIHSVESGASGSVQWSTYIYADGIQAVNIPAKSNFDYATVYIFGYID